MKKQSNFEIPSRPKSRHAALFCFVKEHRSFDHVIIIQVSYLGSGQPRVPCFTNGACRENKKNRRDSWEGGQGALGQEGGYSGMREVWEGREGEEGGEGDMSGHVGQTVFPHLTLT